MQNELSRLFPSYKQLVEYPAELNSSTYLFRHPEEDTWFSIKKTEVSEREYALLSSLFNEVKPAALLSDWRRFLERNGNAPLDEETEVRIIQLYFNTAVIEKDELAEASEAFFGQGLELVFLSSQYALLIEQKSSYVQTPADFLSYITALESDLYLKTKLYIGKFRRMSATFREQFVLEKSWFLDIISANEAERIYTIESAFLHQLMIHMPQQLKKMLTNEILMPLDYDLEILQTVRLFFENGFNASITAKKLFIHRNTLQYRLAKFQDITGISVRSFDGALVAYYASLIAAEK